MIRYFETENATLELFFRTTEQYLDFLKKNIVFIMNQNFKRVILHIKRAQFEILNKEVTKLFVDSSILIIYYISIGEKGIYLPKLKQNVSIVNTNHRRIIKDKNIYNYIKVTKNNIEIVSGLINGGTNLILEIKADPNKIKHFNDIIFEIRKRVPSNEINLSGLVIPTFLMKEHPCNAYLCDGWKCKKPISRLPRHLSIKGDYNVYPHDLFFDSLLVGNVENKTLGFILKKYFLSANYEKFLFFCRKVFVKYLSSYPYIYMPLIEYVRMEAQNDR